MSKEKDINNGFMLGDIVKHKKGGIEGTIREFEWSGIRRAAVETEQSKGYYIISVEDLELVFRPEKEVKNEKGSKKGDGKKD